MFICKPCLEQEAAKRPFCPVPFGEHFIRSFGRCEFCTKSTGCVDCPSNHYTAAIELAKGK